MQKFGGVFKGAIIVMICAAAGVFALVNENYAIKNYGRYWHGYQIILP